MGTYGIGIFASNIAEDVRADYMDALKAGRSDEQALEYVMAYGKDLDKEEACGFWTALAMTQWKIGRLTEDVKSTTIDIINHGGDIWLLEESNCTQSEIAKRKQALQDCKEKLLSEMPPYKQIKKIVPFALSPWKFGDIVAHQIADKSLMDTAYYGKYFVFQIAHIEHREHAFKELESDTISIRVYDYLSDELPTFEQIKHQTYLRFDTLEKEQKFHSRKPKKYLKKSIFVRPIGWLSKKEIDHFLKTSTIIGNDNTTEDFNCAGFGIDHYANVYELTVVNAFKRFSKKYNIGFDDESPKCDEIIEKNRNPKKGLWGKLFGGK